MRRIENCRRAAEAALFIAVVCLLWSVTAHAQQAAPDRGTVLFSAGGCANCHTDRKNKGPLLAGGRPLKTPFGTFYSPNITADPTHGIGRWSDAQFIRAMRDGVGPNGSHYFPVFPYTSFTNMTDEDMLAIKRHIMTLPAVAKPNRAHDVAFPFSLRFGQFFWKLLFFDRGPYKADPAKSAEWNRGAYLVTAVAHCGECHTTRNLLGGLDRDRWLAGASKENGPEGVATPNITPNGKSGIGKWSIEEIVDYIQTGANPEGDYAGSLMADVIENGTDKLSTADARAIAVYLKSLPAR